MAKPQSSKYRNMSRMVTSDPFRVLYHERFGDDALKSLCSLVGFDYDPAIHSRNDWNDCVEISQRNAQGVITSGVYIACDSNPLNLSKKYQQQIEMARNQESGRILVDAKKEPMEGYGIVHWKRK